MEVFYRFFYFLAAISFGCFTTADNLFQSESEYIRSRPVNYDCRDVDVTHQEGIITSPNYPSLYPIHVSCSWRILGNVGDVITVWLDDVDIEESCTSLPSPCCIFNWLKIGLLANDTEKRVCGRNFIYEPIVSKTNMLGIKFHIGTFLRGGRGFMLRYKIDSCPSGRSCHSVHQCYNETQQCDGKRDCSDYTDEVDCGFCRGNLTRCGANSTQCYNPFTQKCDKVFHCLNGEDEKGCNTLCPDKIMCDSGRGCYPMKKRCNGIASCEDWSDEKNCVPELCNKNSGTFLCENKRCILRVWTCDRVDDCGDGSDERNCVRPIVMAAALLGSLAFALLLVTAIHSIS